MADVVTSAEAEQEGGMKTISDASETGNISQMFQEGCAKIATRRTDNLFQALEQRELTDKEKDIIARRVELQRKVFLEYERREKLRKVAELLDVCADLTEAEAEAALEACEEREDDAAARLVSDPIFRRRVAVAAGVVPATVISAGPRSYAAPAGARPRPVDPATLAGGVFVGAFRGKGYPTGPNRPTATLRTLRRAAVRYARAGGPRMASARPDAAIADAQVLTEEEEAEDGDESDDDELVVEAEPGVPAAFAEGISVALAEQRALGVATPGASGEEGGVEAAPGGGGACTADYGDDECGSAPVVERMTAAVAATGRTPQASEDEGEGPASGPMAPAAIASPPSAPPTAVSSPAASPLPARRQSARAAKSAALAAFLVEDSSDDDGTRRRGAATRRQAARRPTPQARAAPAARPPAAQPTAGSGDSSETEDEVEVRDRPRDPPSLVPGCEPALVTTGYVHRGRVKQKSHKSTELVCAGELRVGPGWHNAGYIFPAGFESRTLFRSSVALDSLCVHVCSILAGPGPDAIYHPAPTFRVVALDRPDEPLLGKSCTGCWTAVLRRINGEIEARRAAGEDLPPPPKTAIAGPEYFGLNQVDIQGAVEALDRGRSCAAYWAGKEQRMRIAAGTPVASRPATAPRLPRARRPAASSRPAKRRRGRFGAASSEEDPSDDETSYVNRWGAIDRAARYAKRRIEDGAADADDDNPVPDLIDPITLDPVVRPAISPYGHVMGYATWRAVLAEQNVCPFTKQPLHWEACKVLTRSNFHLYKDKIIR